MKTASNILFTLMVLSFIVMPLNITFIGSEFWAIVNGFVLGVSLLSVIALEDSISIKEMN